MYNNYVLASQWLYGTSARERPDHAVTEEVARSKFDEPFGVPKRR